MAQALPIAEAAKVLGMSAAAVRKRVKRGSLPAHKGEDGLWYVHVDQVDPESLPSQPAHQDAAQGRVNTEATPLVAQLQQENARLWAKLRAERESRGEELRRKDIMLAEFARHLADLNRRLPELPATTSTPEPSPRTWWQRLWSGA